MRERDFARLRELKRLAKNRAGLGARPWTDAGTVQWVVRIDVRGCPFCGVEVEKSVGGGRGEVVMCTECEGVCEFGEAERAVSYTHLTLPTKRIV